MTISSYSLSEVRYQDPTQGVSGDISEAASAVPPLRLDHRGFSISTYQNKSDPLFASQSNWGQYELSLFTEEKQNKELASGGGVDVLTPEGRELICDLILKSNGNTLRFSVEWAHLEATPGTIDEIALQHYVEAAAYIKSRGIVPIITLHHFVEPLWFTQMGGFEKTKNIDYFVRFCRQVYDAISEHVSIIVTFNEPAVPPTMGLVLGDFPPNRIGRFTTHTTVLNNIMEAHCRVYDTLHQAAREKGKQIQVGFTHQTLKFIPESTFNVLAKMVCSVMTYRFHGLWMDLMKKQADKFDFIGVQYYSRPLIGGFPPNSTCLPNEEMVESMGFRFDPAGIGEVTEEVATEFPDKPIIISESGTAGDSSSAGMDAKRARYYQISLTSVAGLQNRGVNIIGYLAWTLFGNFEWNHGYSRRHDFGVVHRAKGSMEYRLTDAFHLLAQIFSRAALPQQIPADEDEERDQRALA